MSTNNPRAGEPGCFAQGGRPAAPTSRRRLLGHKFVLPQRPAGGKSTAFRQTPGTSAAVGGSLFLEERGKTPPCKQTAGILEFRPNAERSPAGNYRPYEVTRRNCSKQSATVARAFDHGPGSRARLDRSCPRVEDGAGGL